MGLFGFGKKSSSTCKVPSLILKADEVLTLSRQTQTMGDIDAYLTPACACDFADRLLRDEKEPVGLKRYQKISWIKESATSWLKCVTYENIALSHRVTVPLGEDYKERWTLTSDEKRIDRMELIYE